MSPGNFLSHDKSLPTAVVKTSLLENNLLLSQSCRNGFALEKDHVDPKAIRENASLTEVELRVLLFLGPAQSVGKWGQQDEKSHRALEVHVRERLQNLHVNLKD